MLICGQKNSVEKKAANLRKQTVTTNCRGEFQCGAKPWLLKSSGSPCLKNYPVASAYHLFRRPRPRRINYRTMCVKQSQLCCVKLHEQLRRGESLFASTKQPVYRLSPPLLRRGGFRRGCGTSPSRRGRVR